MAPSLTRLVVPQPAALDLLIVYVMYDLPLILVRLILLRHLDHSPICRLVQLRLSVQVLRERDTAHPCTDQVILIVFVREVGQCAEAVQHVD